MFYYSRYDAKKFTLDLSKILQVATALQQAYENLHKKESELALQAYRDFLPMDEAASGAAHHYFFSVEGGTASCWKLYAFPIQFSTKIPALMY